MITINMEDVIGEILTGDAQKNALAFARCLRANDMTFGRGQGYWADKNYWMIQYENEYVCFVLVGGDSGKDDAWTVWSDDSGSPWFADAILAEPLKAAAWENVDICGRCGSCGGGTRKTVFGRVFDNVCRTVFKFDNPGAAATECLRQLVALRKNDISRKETKLWPAP